jgi:hypothetical protein
LYSRLLFRLFMPCNALTGFRIFSVRLRYTTSYSKFRNDGHGTRISSGVFTKLRKPQPRHFDPESSIGTHVPVSSAKLYDLQMPAPASVPTVQAVAVPPIPKKTPVPPYFPVGWQIEFATKAGGLSLKAASLLLPNRSLADQSLTAPCGRKNIARVCSDSGTPRPRMTDPTFSPLWAAQFIPWVLTYQCKELYCSNPVYQYQNTCVISLSPLLFVSQ